MGNCSSDNGAKRTIPKGKAPLKSPRVGGYGSESMRGSIKAKAPSRSSNPDSSTNNSPPAKPAPVKPKETNEEPAQLKSSVKQLQDTLRARSGKTTMRSGDGIVIENNGSKRIVSAATRKENNFNRYATALLQKEECYDDWSKDKWPWPWLLVEPPHPRKSSQADYVLFLKCFKILENGEVDAYESWKKDDTDSARNHLISAAEDKLDRTVTAEETPTEEVNQTDVPTAAGPRHQEIHNIRNVRVSDYEAEVFPKTESEAALLVRTLRSSPLFAHVVRDAELLKLVNCMMKRTVPPHTTLFRQGEIPLQPYFYVAVSGDVFIDGVKQRSCCAFGDFAVTSTQAKSEQTITTGNDNVTCFILENDVFNGIMGRLSHEKREQYKKWLKDIHFLSTQTPAAILQLADALQEKKYNPGEVIVEFDQLGDYMHFIVEGTVDVIGRESDSNGILIPSSKRWVCDFKEGHPIGYCEFFEPEPTRNIADCVAKDVVITARINRQHFEACMGPVKDLLEQLTEAPEYAYYRETKEKQRALDSSQK
eukprot:TRINITY_DN216_c0_g5_i1.p1 TRINITY_DN216_c0_g5~~TRINITY_DN216_c0_g5_i1.p1  ORF type:complete len:536 (+),score=110.86 TRINITY_DN216_c0_g5_i1:44-1651(+)